MDRKASLLVSMIALGAKWLMFSNRALLTWLFIFVARVILISKGYDLLAKVVIVVPIMFVLAFSFTVMIVSKERKQIIFYALFSSINAVLLGIAIGS